MVHYGPGLGDRCTMGGGHWSLSAWFYGGMDKKERKKEKRRGGGDKNQRWGKREVRGCR